MCKKRICGLISAVLIISVFCFSGITQAKTVIFDEFENASGLPNGFKSMLSGNFAKNNDGYFSYESFSGSDGSKPRIYYEIADGANGNIVIESRFKYDTMAPVDYWPVSFTPLDGFTSGYSVNYSFGTPLTIKYDSTDEKHYLCYDDPVITDFANGKWSKYTGGTVTKRVCEFSPGKFYRIKLTLNVDGNTETKDTYYFEVYDEHENLVASNITQDPSAIGLSTGGDGYNFYKLSKIRSIQLNLINIGKNSGYTCPVTMDYAKTYYADTPAVTSSTLADNATGVEEGDKFKICFGNPINGGTLSAIKLLNKDGTEAESLNPVLSEDKLSCEITMPALASETEYSVVISNKVLSEDLVPFTEKIIKFTSAKDSLIFGGKAVNLIDGSHLKSWYTNITKDTENGLLTQTRNRAETDIYPSSLYAPNSETLSLSGNVEIEARMMFNDTAVNAATYNYSTLPIAVRDTGVKDSITYGYAKMLYIAGGKLYATNPVRGETYDADAFEVCTIRPDKFYTFKLNLNIDGNPNTTDLYYYTVTDGENTWTNRNTSKSGYNIGISMAAADYDMYKMTKVDGIYFGVTRTTDTTDSANKKQPVVTYDYIKVSQKQ